MRTIDHEHPATSHLASVRDITRQHERATLFTRAKSDSKLDYLPEEQHAQLCEWMLSKITYQTIIERIAKEFGFTVSARLLTNFYMSHVAPYLIAERTKHLSVVRVLKKDITRNPGEYDESTLDALARTTNRMAHDQESDPRHLKILSDIIIRFRLLALAETSMNVKLRRLAMLERQEKRATQALRNSNLTPEQTASKLREIFDK